MRDLRFPALFACLLAVRIALLAHSQYAVDGDEATVGLMAKHILEGREHPLFAYGADYNGGAALTAYLGAALFAIFGMSERALKAIPLVFSLLALVVVHAFVRRTEGARDALFAALLYGTSVALLVRNFDARGGYAESQVLIPLALWMLVGRCLAEDHAARDDLLLGFVCGFGTYLLEIFAAVAATALGLLVLRDGPRRAWRGAAAWAAGAVVGCAPLLVFGRGRQSLNPWALLAGLRALPVQVYRTLTEYLPRSLSYDNAEGLPVFHWAPNGVEYALLVTSVAALVILRRRLSGLLGWMRGHGRRPAPPTEGVLVAYVVVYLVLFSLHPLAGQDARFLLFLQPAVWMLAGLGLSEALRRSRPALLRLGFGFLLLAGMTNRAMEDVRLYHDDRIWGPLGPSRPGDADALTAYMDAHGADLVVSDDWDLTWRVVFETRERLAARHEVGELRSLLRARRSPSAPPFVVVVGLASGKDGRIGQLLARQGRVYSRAVLAGKVVFLVSRS